MGNYSKIRIYERDFKTESGCPSDLVQKGNSTVIGYYREDAMSDYQITNTPDLPIDKQGNFEDDWWGPIEILTFRCTSSKMMLIELLLSKRITKSHCLTFVPKNRRKMTK